MKKICTLIIIIYLALSSQMYSAELLVEAESFNFDYNLNGLDYNGNVLLYGDGSYNKANRTDTGWVLDQQFMDQMGSPYLLAHGIGNSVSDAHKIIHFPSAGTYKVWVRTLDWVGRWRNETTYPVKRASGNAPGRFEVLINGTPLTPATAGYAPEPTAFGAEGSDWHWQNGGTVAITNPAGVEIKLHDLTGLDGRCDAIYFTTDFGAVPPNQDPQMRTWRQGLLGTGTVNNAGSYNLVIVGGGVAGTCAAVSAARQGLTVALIQDRPVLGGNNSSEVRVGAGGNTNYSPYTHIGDIVKQVAASGVGNRSMPSSYMDVQKHAVVQSEPNIALFLNQRVNQVEMNGSSIAAVIAENIQTGGLQRFTGQNFADCTGDGCVGYLAGADWEMTASTAPMNAADPSNQTLNTYRMGTSNLWRILNLGTAVSFSSTPWALNLYGRPVKTDDLGNWNWEGGFYHDPFLDNEYIRDWNFRAMYGSWDAMKNSMSLYPNYALEWQAYIGGKRESRRLLGDVILQRSDFVNKVVYDDGCFPTSWGIDLHYPSGTYDDDVPGDEYLSWYKGPGYTVPYWVPYRCLYSRNINNLFMAGRNISVNHDGLGPVRVQNTTGMMGEVVGIAAAICKKYGVSPRGVYTAHLNEFKTRLLAGIPETPPPFWLDIIGPNYALNSMGAVVTTNSSTYSGNINYINDGLSSTSDNASRWLTTTIPNYVKFTLPAPRYISAARIVSGYNNNGTLDSCINDFYFEYWNGSSWTMIPNSNVVANSKNKWIGRFTAVQSNQFRLVVIKTPGNYSRLWEIELYHPQADMDPDGTVALSDLVILAGQWLNVGTGLNADFDASKNSKVDMSDFNILSELWNW